MSAALSSPRDAGPWLIDPGRRSGFPGDSFNATPHSRPEFVGAGHVCTTHVVPQVNGGRLWT